MKVEDQVLSIARTRASIEHRAGGGTGAAPTELVQRHAAEIARELDRDDLEALKTAPAEERTAPAPVAPTLADGAEARKNYRALKTADGREARCYGKGQRMHTGFTADGMTIEDFGNGLAAMAGNVRGFEAERRALSTNVNTAGGIMVPEEVSAMIIDNARAISRVFQAGAMTIDMPAADVTIPRITEDPAFAVVAENSEITADDPAFDSVNLHAAKHAVLVKVSNELLEDGVGAGAAITNAISNAFAAYLDQQVLRFLLDSNGITAETSVAAINYDDLLNAMQAIMIANGTPNAAILHPKSIIALAALKSATDEIYMQPPPMLASLAMLSSTNIDDDEGIVGDFTKALVGVRGGLSLEFSRDAGDAYAYDQTWIRAIWRGDFNAAQISHFRALTGISY
jgi:HK97 family phage major capsid protein